MNEESPEQKQLRALQSPHQPGCDCTECELGATREYDTTDAKERVKLIKRRIGQIAWDLEKLPALVADAYADRDWETLGYQDWPSYVEGEFGTSLLRLDAVIRKQWAVTLRGRGLSQKEIAAVVNVSQRQVSTDVRSSSNVPDTRTDSLGRKQPTSKPRGVSDYLDEVTAAWRATQPKNKPLFKYGPAESIEDWMRMLEKIFGDLAENAKAMGEPDEVRSKVIDLLDIAFMPAVVDGEVVDSE
jgi:hypothetical protein